MRKKEKKKEAKQMREGCEYKTDPPSRNGVILSKGKFRINVQKIWLYLLSYRIGSSRKCWSHI